MSHLPPKNFGLRTSSSRIKSFQRPCHAYTLPAQSTIANFVYTSTIQELEVLPDCAGCPATDLGIHLHMAAGAVAVDRRAGHRTVHPVVAVHIDLRHVGHAVAVRTDHQMEVVRTDLVRALVGIVQESVDCSRRVGQTDALVGAGRIAVEVERSSSILAGRSHAGYTDHVEGQCVHILPELELCRIVKCYAAVKSGHIVLVEAEDCTSSDVIDLHILRRHLGAATEAGIVKTIDVVQTACSLKAVRCRCMFHSVLWKCIRSCSAAKNRGSLHQGCLQTYHQDRQMIAESSVGLVLAGCEVCFLRP